MLKDFPKISIVTPVYNRADMLEQTIISVLGQNYPNLEYIIIDGGSTDGTVDIIKKYEDRLAYWVSEPDNGMYHAIQKGFEKASGEIMAWINSDDLYHTDALWIVAEIFSDLPALEWVVGTPTMYNGEGRCVKVFPTVRWSKRKFELGDYRWIQQESVFWKRILWDKTGAKLDLNYKLAADFELWTRFFKYAQLHSVNTILGGFRLHGAQLSIEQAEKYENEVRCICYNRLFSYNRLTKFLPKFLLKRIYCYPKLVCYDFVKNKWVLW